MKYNIDKSAQKFSLASIEANVPTVTTNITIDLHSAAGTQKSQAVEHMYADSLLSGAGSMTRDEFIGAINLLGASVSVKIANGYLIATLKCRGEQYKKLLKLVELMFTEPTFNSKEIKRIKDTSINELEQAKEDSRSIAHSNLLNKLYGPADRKYSQPIDEIIAAVPTVSKTNFVALHNKVRQSRWIVSVAGKQADIDFTKRFLDKIIVKNATNNSGPHKQLQPKAALVTTNIPSRSNIDFSIGAPIPITLHHPDYLPLTLGINVLAKWGGFSGRLMSTVREKEGLTYGIYGSLQGFSNNEQGLWRIMTFFAPDKALQGIASTYRELKKFYQHGITEEELSRFKTITKTGQTLVNDSIGGMLADLHNYHVHGFSLAEMKVHKDKIDKLTRKEVNQAIKKHLDPRQLVISAAGPTKTVKKDLLKFIKGV
tara:strand:+ start:185 stop:1468 length:1284 start_codon:yes stop_codon:yes gene_type:complete